MSLIKDTASDFILNLSPKTSSKSRNCFRTTPDKLITVIKSASKPVKLNFPFSVFVFKM